MSNKYTKCGSYNLDYLIDLGAVVNTKPRVYVIGGGELPEGAVLINDYHVGTIVEPKNKWGEQPVKGTGAPLDYIVKK